MKLILSLVTLLLSSQAFAVTDIACWNIFSRKGSKPFLTAKIIDGTTLTQVSLNFENPTDFFSSYVFDDKREIERLGKKETIHKHSELIQPTGDLEASEITTNRSPYKGNNEYTFTLGSYFYKTSFGGNHNGKYAARIILPNDLSRENLAKFRIRSATERSNAVMIYSPPYSSSQSGDNYYRMFCVSK